MITKIDNYYLGQSVNEAPDLREHTPEEYKYAEQHGLKRMPKDEKLFNGKEVVFNGVAWRTLISASGEKICKIVIQNVSKDRATLDQTFKSTLNYLETEMGPGVMGNYSEKDIYYNWESPEGNLLLDRQDKLGVYCVGVKIWQPNGVSYSSVNDQQKTVGQKKKIEESIKINKWKIFGFLIITWLVFSVIAHFVLAEKQKLDPASSLIGATTETYYIMSLIMGIFMSIKFKKLSEFGLGFVFYLIISLLPLTGIFTPFLVLFAGLYYFGRCYYKIELNRTQRGKE